MNLRTTPRGASTCPISGLGPQENIIFGLTENHALLEMRYLNKHKLVFLVNGKQLDRTFSRSNYEGALNHLGYLYQAVLMAVASTPSGEIRPNRVFVYITHKTQWDASRALGDVLVNEHTRWPGRPRGS